MNQHNPQDISITDMLTKYTLGDIPIDPPGAFLRLDVDVIMIDLQFGDFHLKEVGLELDCPAHGAKVGS